ncbi:MAG TPA: fructosamine kinase family protein [Solirubrobacteraceae bacterium]|nr:fructosamine kinase family protein [Solirubrobacteraceae bacterium]
MSLPPGAQVIRRVGGGDINEAFHVVLEDGSAAFVKTRAQAVPGEYATEAAGLEWLAQAGTVRVPRVLAIDEGYLALEWVARGTLSADGAEEFGRGLAGLHAAGAPHFGAPPNASGQPRFGSLALSNEPTDDWPTFYSERRLRPLARIGSERNVLSPVGVADVESVCERMRELCGPPEPPARLHGDLWHGNVMAGEDGVAWLIDPSAYGGHREVDLAMLRLFGAPSERVFSSYEEVAPLADGAPDRVGLYQLLPLLVHALLFGGSYVRAAEQMAARYAR